MVIALLGMLLGWTSHNLIWIRQRHELLARQAARKPGPAEPLHVRVPAQKVFCTVAPTANSAGPWLRLFGEPDVAEVRLYLAPEHAAQNDEIERAAALFPEAQILVYRGTRTAVGWPGSMKARMWPAGMPIGQ